MYLFNVRDLIIIKIAQRLSKILTSELIMRCVEALPPRLLSHVDTMLGEKQDGSLLASRHQYRINMFVIGRISSKVLHKQVSSKHSKK